MTRAVVVGARRARQGIGCFVARTLDSLGVEVAGIVGSTAATVALARGSLASDFGIECAGHTSVADALRASAPDIVVVCSPIERHAEHVASALDGRVPVLCEKPLVGAGRIETARDLVERALQTGVHLSLLTQWPDVLGAYGELFPGWRRGPLRTFRMQLAPSLSGRAAIVDVCAHPISVLQAALGPGHVRDARCERLADGGQRLSFEWVSAHTLTSAEIELAVCPEPPRPAGVGFDGQWAARWVDRRSYAMQLVDGQRRVPLPDPLRACVRTFLERAQQGVPANGELLLGGVAAIDALAAASRAE